MTPLEELAFERRGEIVLGRLKGEVDLSNAALVTDQLLGSVPNTATALVLDLSETDYLDSSGVRMIFSLAHRLEARGQRLQLVIPDQSAINRLLVLTEMHRVVAMSNSLDTALQDQR